MESVAAAAAATSPHVGPEAAVCTPEARRSDITPGSYVACRNTSSRAEVEALGLEARDVQLKSEHPTLRVRRGKGRKAHIVPVHPELAPNVAPTLS